MRLRYLLVLLTVALALPQVARAAFPVAESTALPVSISAFDRSPGVALDGLGNSVVVWNRLSPGSQVVARRFDPQGHTLGRPPGGDGERFPAHRGHEFTRRLRSGLVRRRLPQAQPRLPDARPALLARWCQGGAHDPVEHVGWGADHRAEDRSRSRWRLRPSPGRRSRESTSAASIPRECPAATTF